MSSLRRQENPGYVVDTLLGVLRAADWRATRHYNALMRSAPMHEAPRIMMALRGSDQRLRPTEYSYFLLVQAYASLGLMTEARRSVRVMTEKDKLTAKTGIRNLLLEGYARQGDVRSASQVFREICDAGITPNVPTYSHMMMAYGKADMLPDMLRVYEDMTAAGLRPTSRTFEAIIGGYASAGNVYGARWALEAMQREHIKPSDAHFTQIANAYANANDAHACKAYIDDLERSGVHVHVTMFSTMLKAFARLGDHEKVRRLIEKRRLEGKLLNAKVMTTLVQAYANAGKMDEAWNVIERDMLSPNRRELMPTVVTYTVMINGYGKAGELDRARSVLDIMNAQGIRPNSHTLTSLAQWNLRHGSVDDASTFLTGAMQQHAPTFANNRVLMLTLLELYGRRSDFAEMIKLWHKLCESGCFPGIVSKKSTIDLHGLNEWGAKLAVIGELRRIRERVCEMKADSASPELMDPLTIVTGRGTLEAKLNYVTAAAASKEDKDKYHTNSTTSDSKADMSPSSSASRTTTPPLPMIRRVVGDLLASLQIHSWVPADNEGCTVVPASELERLGALESAQALRIGGLAPMLLPQDHWMIHPNRRRA